MTILKFPEGFLWGAATSAYQIEGSPHADGAGMSIQHRYAHTPGNSRNGESGDVAADHYHRYRDDIQIMRDLGLKAYQFSVAWPRLLPDGIGRVNQPGLDFYDRLVDALLEAGIAPVPILHVWDFPAVLQDRGGWANRDSAEWFGEFAAAVYKLIGDRATHWLTICEPTSIAYGGYLSGVIAPAVRDLYSGMLAAHHVMLAHGRAVQAFRASGAKGLIGTSTMVADIQPASSSEADRIAAGRVHAFYNEMFIDPVLLGTYPQQLVDWFGEAWPPILDGDMAIISAPIDFLGVTYYMGMTIAAAEAATTDRPSNGTGGKLVGELRSPVGQLLDVRFVPHSGPVTGLGWPIHPAGVVATLEWIRDRYGNPPVLLTENGAAFPDIVKPDGKINDVERIAYIRDHLAAAHEAIAHGVNLQGWFVWAFLDTWEFSLGYEGRFGIVYIDYDSQRRIVKDSGYWFRDVMAQNGFQSP